MKMKLISVVVPVFNEEDCIRDFVRDLLAELEKSVGNYEVILVDDGSTDDTVSILDEFKSNKKLHLTGFTKNRGQSAAMDYGVLVAKGDVCVTLDADGQNDPGDISMLLSKLTPNSVVCGIRSKRKDYLLRKMFSVTARKLLNVAGGVKVHDPGCTLKAFYKEDFLNIPYFNGMHRFIPYLMHMNGVNLIQVPVTHHPRLGGASKYGLWSRTFRVFFDIFGLYWLRKRSKPYYKVIKR